MSRITCVPEDELAEFLHGNLEAARLEQIVRHVDECSSCQETVEALSEQSDTFADAWREVGPADPSESDPEFRQATQQLLETPHSNQAPHATLPQVKQLGPYRLLEPLGSGGMGTVYKALHTKLKRAVALKILPTTRWTKAAAIARFEREMEAIGALDHPHIVRASDAGEDPRHALPGDGITWTDWTCHASSVAWGGCQWPKLARSPGRPHWHCKMRTKTIWCTATSSPPTSCSPRRVKSKCWIWDWPCWARSTPFDQHELTTVGQLMGTLDYMSPEQGMNSHEVDIRADIYSLGATLYKLLTARAPFAGPSYNSLLKKVSALANQPAPSIGLQRGDLPPELVTLVDRMLSKDPQQRFDSPQQVADALAPFAANADLTGLARDANAGSATR